MTDHTQPAGHSTPTHLHRGRARPGHELLRCLGIDADEDAALPARRDRHVAADEEREAAEHLLLGDVLPTADQLADALCEDLVVRHA